MDEGTKRYYSTSSGDGASISKKIRIEDDSDYDIQEKNSMQFDSPDGYTDTKDDMESSCELEELQQFSPFVERYASDDETTSGSTAKDLRYLIELNEQGLIVDFNLNDYNEREECTEVDSSNPVDVIERSLDNMINIFSR
ncbi:hypothetical protein QAD02_021424 [Eretmocerus hayati]|uniref:Uncharacterized protein n=1 Tax=Eretmocerus hayati TaxID=131215 RepID=A0ACC2PS34_9HYME|nr:hypothetical protein QAD02_021424 [Eretmocerus hayati]